MIRRTIRLSDGRIVTNSRTTDQTANRKAQLSPVRAAATSSDSNQKNWSPHGARGRPPAPVVKERNEAVSPKKRRITAPSDEGPTSSQESNEWRRLFEMNLAAMRRIFDFTESEQFALSSRHELQIRLEMLELGWIEFANVCRQSFLSGSNDPEMGLETGEEIYLAAKTELRSRLEQLEVAAIVVNDAEDPQSNGEEANVDDDNLPTFWGDFRKWGKFRESFIATVHQDPRLTDSQRLQKLLGCLRGNAKRTIRYWDARGGDENYLRSWEDLRLKYNTLCIRALFDEMYQMTRKPVQTTAEFYEYLGTVRENYRQLTSLLTVDELADFHFVYFTEHLMNVSMLREWERFGPSAQDLPTMDQLLHFLDNRSRDHDVDPQPVDKEGAKNPGGNNNNHNSSSSNSGQSNNRERRPASRERVMPVRDRHGSVTRERRSRSPRKRSPLASPRGGRRESPRSSRERPERREMRKEAIRSSESQTRDSRRFVDHVKDRLGSKGEHKGERRREESPHDDDGSDVAFVKVEGLLGRKKIQRNVARMCSLCSTPNHSLFQCRLFMAMPFAKRWSITRELGVCENCSYRNHQAAVCRRLPCPVCVTKKHHDLLCHVQKKAPIECRGESKGSRSRKESV